MRMPTLERRNLYNIIGEGSGYSTVWRGAHQGPCFQLHANTFSGTLHFTQMKELELLNFTILSNNMVLVSS